MSETKFTPGPWRVPYPETVWSTSFRHGKYASSGAVICEHVGANPYGDDYIAERRANAHLIAAAPTMYKQLEAFPVLLRPAMNDYERQVQDWILSTLNVIAQARGEA